MSIMEEKFYRDSWAEVDLDAITHNIHELKQRLSGGTGIYAVVKADGYGHGDVQVAAAALEAGAERLAVALLDEALRLRQAGFTVPILVMGYTRPQDAAVAGAHGITVTVYQKEWVEQVESPVDVHLKIDTGMGRIGVRTTEEMDGVLRAIRENKNVGLTGVFTHFAKADDEDLSYYEEQNRRLEELLEHFTTKWTEEVTIHTGNSAASMRFPEQMHHFVRYGISMYGLYPSGDVKQEKPLALEPAFSLHSNLVHVKKLEAGESVSYGATYETTGEEWIGTVPLGYADGWLRKLQGAEVLVDGERCEIVGRICMDQFMIRLDRPYPIGTEVVLIGKQGEDEIETDEIADHLDTINYEIPCIISGRVPRVYKKDGETTAISHRLQNPIV